MKAKLLIAALIMVITLNNCTKSGFTTAPQLTFKDVNATTFSQGDVMTFALDFTDKEGDVQSHLYVEKKTLNCTTSKYAKLDSIPGSVPKTSYTKGEINLTFAYNAVEYDINGNRLEIMTGSSCQAVNRQNDTCIFRFALTDKANHTSDTVSSPIIVLKN